MHNLKSTLEFLMRETQLNTSQLARLTGLSQPIIYRIVTGENLNPKLETIKKIAGYFEISIAQLVGEDSLIEQKAMQKKNHCQLVPILQRSQLKLLPNISKCKITEYVYSDKISNIEKFAYHLDNTTMEPTFLKNSLLIFEQVIDANDQDYILVLISDNITFKQILYDGCQPFLKPINSSFKAEKTPSDHLKILGKLVEARVYFSAPE